MLNQLSEITISEAAQHIANGRTVYLYNCLHEQAYPVTELKLQGQGAVIAVEGHRDFYRNDWELTYAECFLGIL